MKKYEIKAPVECTGLGWGLAWVQGLAHTDDAELAAKLARKGYTVTDKLAPVGEQAAQNPAPAPAPKKALEDMTVTELRSFAAAHGIDVTGAAKKQDLLLAVQTAVEPSAAPAEAVPGEQPETAAE